MRGDARDGPIYSSLADDPASSEAVDAFVLQLAERIDELQDTEVGAGFDEVSRLAGELSVDAAKAGYDPLARAAAAAQTSCHERAAEDVRKALLEVTEVARRVRLGHRGAV